MPFPPARGDECGAHSHPGTCRSISLACFCCGATGARVHAGTLCPLGREIAGGGGALGSRAGVCWQRKAGDGQRVTPKA